MKKGLIIIGGGGHAKVLLDALELQSDLPILGYVDSRETALDCPYRGDDESLLENHSPSDVYLVNAVGSTDLPHQRRDVYLKFKKMGYKFSQVIHPRSIISKSAKIGEGVQILAGSVVNPGTVIEENVILNTSSSIDHDCHIKAHTHIAPGVVTSGCVTIGQGCHVGTGAKIIQRIRIGDAVLVAAGAVVTTDMPDHVRCAGVPARIISR